MKISFKEIVKGQSGKGLSNKSDLSAISSKVAVFLTKEKPYTELKVHSSILKSLKASRSFKGSFGQIVDIITPAGTNLDYVFVIGLGDGNAISNITMQQIGGKISSRLNSMQIKSADIIVDKIPGIKMTPEQIIKSLGIGIKLKNYKFNRYYIKKKETHKLYLEEICFISENSKQISNNIKEDLNISDSVFFTRDLVSMPANDLFPETFVKECKKLSKLGIKIKVLNKKDMEKLGMNALLGVAQGSSNAPYTVIMEWKNKKSSKDGPLAFVGKGVTFDTGGISLKPSLNMGDMKYDMGGAGVVTGLMHALASRKAKAHVIGAIGIVENMCSGTAQRPGDVVKSMSGQTIEVDNTDAEGRLVLGDVLWYVKKKYCPKFIIDLATLTGAMVVALGHRYAGLFSNNDNLANKIVESGKTTGEGVWRMPLEEYYDKQINSNIADIKNVGAGYGAGSTTAAQFLHRFVDDVEWAHIDIAGVTWNKDAANDLSPVGATGFGVRLLNHLVKDYYEN